MVLNTSEAVQKFERLEVMSHTSKIPVFEFPEFVKQQQEDANSRGKQFVDGTLVAVNLETSRTSIVNDGVLYLNTQTIKYSQHGFFRAINGRVMDGNRPTIYTSPLQALYLSGIIVTDDNYLVLGVADEVEKQFSGKLGLPAKSLKPKQPDVSYDKPDIICNFLANMKSDTGVEIIPEAVLPGWIMFGSAREGYHHLTAFYRVRLPLGRSDVESGFKPGKFGKLEFVRNTPDDITALIETSQVLGRTADALETWVVDYRCD